jgi:hypothetical protein
VALTLNDIRAVDAGGGYLDKDFTGTRLGHGSVYGNQDFRATRLGNFHRFHRISIMPRDKAALSPEITATQDLSFFLSMLMSSSASTTASSSSSTEMSAYPSA